MIRFFLLKQQQASAGFALFAGGVNTGDAVINTVELYNYNTEIVSNGASITTARTNFAGCSNSVVGILGGGNGTNGKKTDVYVFASNACSAGTEFGTSREACGAAGTSTTAFFVGGYESTYTYNKVEKYVFANNAISYGTNLINGRYGLAGAGNTSFGIFFGDDQTQSAATQKYTYATNVVTSGTSLSAGRSSPGAAGNSSIGIFAGGSAVAYPFSSFASNTNKYTYSGDVVSTGGNLSLARIALSGAGNGNFAIFAFGRNGNIASTYQKITDKYTYSSNVSVSGTNMSAVRGGTPAACSSTPGHL